MHAARLSNRQNTHRLHLWNMSTSDSPIFKIEMRAAYSMMCLLALCFAGSALGFTFTFYTDNACKTMASSSLNGASNPLVIPLNTCSKTLFIGNQYYAKVTACSSTSTAFNSFCTSSDCSGASCQAFTQVPGQCITDNPPPGAQSYTVTCAPASKASVALLAVAAAVLAVL